MIDEFFMRSAINEAIIAKNKNEIPVGAVIVRNNEIISKGHNETILYNSQLYHAEINSIISASKHLSDWRLNDCDIYVTMEPCLMCFGAIILSRIRRLVFGINNNISGFLSSDYKFNIQSIKIPIINGILEEEIIDFTKDYFDNLRDK